MSFSHQDRETIFKIHRDVMNAIVYKEDYDNFKLLEFWEGDDLLLSNMRKPGVRFGDCDEFAIEFMIRCMAKGLDARLIHVVVYGQFGHLICEVATKNRDEALYLDNRFYRPVAFYELDNYIFLRASPWNPQRGERRPWKTITGIRIPK